MANDISTGYQPGQSQSDRRAAFDLRRLIRDLATRVGLLEETPWIAVGSGGSAYGTNVANLGGFVSRFRKVGDSVEIEFVVAVSAAAVLNLFTLPAGYWPTVTQEIRACGSDFGAVQVYQRVDITTAGAVRLVPTSPGVGNVFGGFRFSTV